VIDKISEEIQTAGYSTSKYEIHEGNPVILIIKDYKLPPRFNVGTSDLLLKLPINYPQGKPDMFWLQPDAMPSKGKLPFGESKEHILGKEWFRYSWHLNDWNPVSDNLGTYLCFIDTGLRKVANGKK